MRADDLGVGGQVGHARRVLGQLRGGRDHHDGGVREVGQRAGADRARAAEREHLLEVHHVRGDLQRAAVDDDDVEGLVAQQEVQRGGRADAARSPDECDRGGHVRRIGSPPSSPRRRNERLESADEASRRAIAAPPRPRRPDRAGGGLEARHHARTARTAIRSASPAPPTACCTPVWHHPTGPNTEDLLHTPISAVGQGRRRDPGAVGLDRLHEPRGGQRPGRRPARVLGWLPHDRHDRSAEGDQHRALGRRRRQLGAAAGPGQPGRRAGLREPDLGRPCAAARSSRRGSARSARGCTPVSPRRRRTSTTRRRSVSYGNEPQLATDAERHDRMAWYSNATGHLGVLRRRRPGRRAGGSAQTMPNTSDLQVGMLGRTPFVARPGGGLYAAYPTGYPTQNRVRVWRVGTRRPAGSQGERHGPPVAIAGAPDGRLWIAWIDNRGGEPASAPCAPTARRRVGARPSPRAAGKARGATGSTPARRRAGADVLGNFNDGTSSTTATYHRRLLPGPTLRAAPRRSARARGPTCGSPSWTRATR